MAKEKKAKAKKARESKIPVCPPENGTDGSKTPEVMEWYRKYAPEEYARKYHTFELNRS